MSLAIELVREMIDAGDTRIAADNLDALDVHELTELARERGWLHPDGCYRQRQQLLELCRSMLLA
jgi:hypothetical protein